MGAPKRQRKKYSSPSHPWQKERILTEKDLSDKYGLRRKYEIWKMNSILKNFSNQAKRLITEKTSNVDLERSQLLKKLNVLGLLDKNTKIADVLSITLNDILERRLQTLVFKRNLARSIVQARQFITHKHIMVGSKRITTPSYLVPIEEENFIQFAPTSSLANPNHAERFIEEKKSKVIKKEIKEEVKKKPELKEEKKKEEIKDKKTTKESKEKKQVNKKAEKENTEVKDKKPKEGNK